MSKVVQTETLIRTYIREHHNFILRKDFNLMYIFTLNLKALFVLKG